MLNLRPSPAEVKPERRREAVNFLYLGWQLVRRDFEVRFTGSALGFAWAIIQPLSLVALYWFVFTVMIPRGPGAGDPSYPLFLISGILPWVGFNEGLMRSATAILDNASMVRRLPFRSELLVVVPNVTALLFETIALGLFVVILAATGRPPFGVWLLPFALAIQLALQIGLGWVLSVMTVFFRDVTQILGFLLSILFFLSPILYPLAGRFESWFLWNPLTPLLGLFRSALVGDALPRAHSIVLLLVIAAVAFAGGLRVFRRAQPGLADLI